MKQQSYTIAGNEVSPMMMWDEMCQSVADKNAEQITNQINAIKNYLTAHVSNVEDDIYLNILPSYADGILDGILNSAHNGEWGECIRQLTPLYNRLYTSTIIMQKESHQA